MSKYQFDNYIKSEVESIDFDGGLEAWELFDANRTPEVKPAVGIFALYWKPFVAAASVSVFCGILLHQSLVNDQVGDIPHTFASDHEINMTSEIEEAISINKFTLEEEKALVVSNQSNKVEVIKEESPRVIKSESQSIKSPQLLEENTNLVANVETETKVKNNFSQGNNPSNTPIQTVIRQSEILASLTQPLLPREESVKEQRQVTSLNHKVGNASLIPSISSAALSGIDQSAKDYAAVMTENIINIKQRRFRIFGELSIGNRQAGQQAVVGVSVLKDSWSLEAGVGLNHKGNRSIEHTDVVESNFRDYDENHTYKFTQKMNAIFPLKVRKRLGKRHAILVGAQASYNLSNQIDINSSIPVRASSAGGATTGTGASEGEIRYYDISYKYSNASTVINSFGVVSSQKWNVDLAAGYEFNFDRVALGVTVLRPVLSTFSVSNEVSSPVNFKINEQTRLNLSLKYYLG